jgi:sugar (pentulose or hexulose) kinase
VSIAETASEGGAWGIAVLASYAASGATESLAEYLQSHVFPGASFTVVEPHPDDVDGFATYLNHYRAGLAIERTAADSI